ncbi:YafY family protein [Xanthomonas campestris pv. campestris]|uniref:helix-turn-helix transcriptional regulator n=1 Tax=Xanthomonas campestris TaxID=339 RepID=UPI002AD5A5B0|nr:YafY family protein [Xanthomonas campestris]MEA0737819.1 YafY family protein [Xanthomonas campestris pv. campestris]
MSRSQRLFDLLQVLRRHRGTVSGRTLAQELGVSLRTIRRDIATLQATGADIEGEAGVGYILRPGFVLPPLALTEEELRALVTGAQWVSRQSDEAMTQAVQNALAKLDGVIPQEMRPALDDSALYISRGHQPESIVDLGKIRKALHAQRKLRIGYTSTAGVVSERTIWPIMLGLVDARWKIAAWCEACGDFRIFRAEAIGTIDYLQEQYQCNRRQLVKQWRASDRHPCKQGDC